MPVAMLCAAASSGSARVPEPAIDSSTHVVSFVTLETRAIKDFEPAAYMEPIWVYVDPC